MTFRMRQAVDARGLSRPAAAVLRELAYYARPSGEIRWAVTDAQLAAATGYGRHSLRRARLELQAEQRIRVLELGSGRTGTRYAVVLDAEPIQPLEPVVEPVVEPVPPVVEPVPPVVPPGDPAGGAACSPRGLSLQPLASGDPSIRARTGFYEVPKSSPPSPADAGVPDPNWAEQCPYARGRGKPCTNCRACGTSRRAQARRRRAVARERERQQSIDVTRRLYDAGDDEPAGEPVDLESIDPRWRRYARGTQ